MWTLGATDPLVVVGFSTLGSAALLLLAWVLSRVARLLTEVAVLAKRLDDHDKDHADYEDRLRSLERAR